MQGGDSMIAALPDPIERCRGEMVQMAKSRLHHHSEPVVARFRTAPGTTAGLLLAAEEVRGLRLRLISPDTMNTIGNQAEDIVRSISRGV
jgi:hypothetical protein